jgi:putative membrane protein
MMRISAAASLAVLLTLAMPAAAQAPPAGSKPAMPDPGVPKLSPGDRGFARDAAIGGMAEVELGKLAASKAQDDAVKAFARQMIEDHGKANEQLAAIVKDAEGTLPTELDQEHKDVQKSLSGLSGAAFDRAYMDAQVKDHQTAAQLFAQEVDGGYNAELKKFAAATLPIIHRHLEMARALQMRLPAPAEAAPLTGSSMPAAAGNEAGAPGNRAAGSGRARDNATTRELNREELEKATEGKQ